jgi:hypothetical protein
LVTPGELVSTAPTVPLQSFFQFQFSIQALLIFFVFASCTASLYGIHYRQLWPQREAMMRLTQYWPRYDGIDGIAWSLDFSNCTHKPSDADLADVAKLTYLDSLDLKGASITDAGLHHLESLRWLDYVILTDTAVTEDGAKRLHEVIPNSSIIYGPRTALKYIKPDNQP